MDKNIDTLVADFKTAIETDAQLNAVSKSFGASLLTNKMLEKVTHCDLDTIVELIITFPQLRKCLISIYEGEQRRVLENARKPTGWENVDMKNPSNW